MSWFESKRGSTSTRPLGEEKYPERLSEAKESKDNMWCMYILRCKNGDLYTGITDNLQRRFNEHVSGKGGHFTKSFGAEKILFSEEHPDKPSALNNLTAIAAAREVIEQAHLVPKWEAKLRRSGRIFICQKKEKD